MNLLIISDTSMLQATDGSGLVVFEPTLREIESVSDLFGQVVWYGYVGEDQKLGSSRAPRRENIQLRLLPTLKGGKSALLKIRILIVLPFLAWAIFRAMVRGDVIHTRGPSVPAAICIILSSLLGLFFRGKIFWHKYAGNWIEKSPPLMYAFQRWMLKRVRNCHVTVNGTWEEKNSCIHSFENPCFTERELDNANRIAAKKEFHGVLTICFVGHLTEAKGVEELLEAVRILSHTSAPLFKLIVCGDGPLIDILKRKAEHVGTKVQFTGYLKREELNGIYESSHILVLPSRTEGFPKVVAECAAYGCIPVVTDVSAVAQYVSHGRNGFLLDDNKMESILKVLRDVLMHSNLKAISEEAVRMSRMFTYEKFKTKVANMLNIP